MSLLFIRHVDSFRFSHFLCDGMPVDLHFVRDKFRDVVGEQEVVVIFLRVLLRQHERFVRLAVRIDIREEKTGVKSVYPTAVENQPTAVTAPRMIAVHILAVGLVQRVSPVVG